MLYTETPIPGALNSKTLNPGNHRIYKKFLMMVEGEALETGRDFSRVSHYLSEEIMYYKIPGGIGLVSVSALGDLGAGGVGELYPQITLSPKPLCSRLLSPPKP